LEESRNFWEPGVVALAVATGGATGGTSAMPVFEYYVVPKGNSWEIDAGDGLRLSYRRREAAIEAAKEAAAKKLDAVVFVKDAGGAAVRVWPSS
jgi:hypothetical protein